MKIVLVSNYLSPHQMPFCNEMVKTIGDGFCFVATKAIAEKRLKSGRKSYDDEYSFVVAAYKNDENKNKALKLIEEADAVIIGSAPEEMIKERKKQKKLILRYSERPLKNGLEPLKYIPRFIKWHKNNPKNVPIYMLCASAYTANDYLRFGLFKNKCYKWGYFPQTIEYDVEKLIFDKEPHSLLWVGRMLDCKHPELSVEVAKKLEAEGYEFKLNIIGNGEREEDIRKFIEKENLSHCVNMLGVQSLEKVREYMEKSEIFMFTSGPEEGWGAVVNEAMNSACAVVASSAAGCVPFLIDTGKNGFSYTNGNADELFQSVKYLIDNEKERVELAKNAYKTIKERWNAKVAANRVLVIVNKFLAKEDAKNVFADGVCSLSNDCCKEKK